MSPEPLVEPTPQTRSGPRGHVHIHALAHEESEEFLCERVSHFLCEGLERGERLLVITTPPHWSAFQVRLRQRRVDVDELLRSGRLAMLDAKEAIGQFMIDGRADWTRFLSTFGAHLESVRGQPEAPLRVFAELVDLLWRAGHPEAALEVEEFWNELAGLHRLEVLCVFDLHLVRLLQERANELQSELVRRTELESTMRLVHEARAGRLFAERVARAAAESAFEESRRARDAAEAAGAAKDEFLAMLGHELRNPLAPIVTALELSRLKRGRGASTVREQELIERQVQHIVRLVDDLLDVSRSRLGKFELKRSEVEISRVISIAVEMAGPQLEQHKHRVRIDVPDADLRVDGDESRLVQVLTNLLNNAARYTLPGGEICISAFREGKGLVIRVQDNGIGIAADLLPHIFDLFVQGRHSTHSKAGLGLGLTLVRSLVELHGGSVRAASDGPGRGSEFLVSLPALPPRGRAALTPLPDEPEAQALDNEQPRRVLLVDDNKDAAKLLGDLLRGLGHEVKTAHDGPAALALIEQFDPQVAILDLDLPEMSGYELAARIRAERKASAPRLISLSGNGLQGDQRRSEQAGFSQHLVKPVATERLERCIRESGVPRRPALHSEAT